jgi:hypothetical protein
VGRISGGLRSPIGCAAPMNHENRVPLLRITVTLAAYQAIVPMMPEDHVARPLEPETVDQGVALWIDYFTLRALKARAQGW